MTILKLTVVAAPVVLAASCGPATRTRAESLAPVADSVGVRGIDVVPAIAVDTTSEFAANAVCIRTPFGPGEVVWNNNPDSTVWRRKPENTSSWAGARSGTQDTDGIHRNGWGCSVFKVPDHCTLTVNGDNDFDCCCNAAASVLEGRCRWVHYSDIGAPRPPGC